MRTNTDAHNLSDVDERQERAYSLHLRGRSYRAIAAELSIDKSTVMRWVAAAARATAPKRKATRQQHLRDAVARLREIQAAAWALYEAHDDSGALNTALNAEREIAKLRGIYELEKVEHGGGVTIRVEHTDDWRGVRRLREVEGGDGNGGCPA